MTTIGGTTSSVLELTPRRFRAVHGQCGQSWANSVIRERSAAFPVLSPMTFCFTFSRECGSGDPSAVAAELPRKPQWSCRTRWPRNMGEDAGPGVQARDLEEWQAGSCNHHWTKTGFTDGIRARLLAKLDCDSLGTPVAHIFDPKKR